MVAAEFPTPPAAIARALCQTDDLEAILDALEGGNLKTIKGRLQAAIARRQHLACQLDCDPADDRQGHSHLPQGGTLVDTLPGIVFQTDPRGTLTFLNSTWTDVCGYTLEESLGVSFLHFLEPVDYAACWHDFQQLMAGSLQKLHCEVRCYPKHDGQPARRLELLAGCLRSETGEIVGAAGLLTDITACFQDADRLRTAIDTIPGLVSWVGRDGKYLGVNQRLADALGRSPEDFIGQPIGFLDNGDSAFRNFLVAFLASDDTHASAVLESEVDGTYRSYSVAGQKYQQGDAAVFVGIDITQSRQAERALRESEEKFRQLAENIEPVFWMLDWTDKKTIYVSPAYEKTWGRPLQTAYRPQAWMDTVHADDYPRVLNAFPQRVRGEYDIEYRILRPSGEVRWIRDRAFPIRDEDGSVYRLAGIAEDITERKRAVEALGKRERYLSALVDVQRCLLATDADSDLYGVILPTLGRVSDASTIYVYESVPNSRQRARLRACWHGASAPGRVATEIPAQLHYSQLPVTWLETLARGEFIRSALADIEPTARDFFNGRAMQSILALPLTVGGQFTGFIGFESASSPQVWDPLTVGLLGSAAWTIALARERQRNQEELQQQLTAIEASTDGIFIVSTAGKLRYANSSYHRILGYPTVNSLVGQDWRQAYPIPESVAKIEADIQIGGKWSGEIVARRLDGSTLLAELSMTVTRDREVVGVCRDISERKQTEETLKASLEEKELLLKEVHHRVKNNLQVISSLFNLSAHATDDPEALAILAESQNRIGSMALVHGKLYQSENLANVDFAEYIRDLIYHLLASYNADSERVRTELCVEDIALNLDAAIPCGLLLNELISNALKHAFPGSRSGCLRISFTNAPGGNLHLSVADDGVGLPPGFDPHKSSTLGFSLIAALTQQLRGSLEMYNDPGATFEITFPQPVARQRF